MPRKAAFKVRAIAELYRQLRYVPPETRHRQMDAAERLIHEIDPARNYPESFVIYRITDYRPESVTEESTLVGEALVADLCNFVLRLSEHLSLPADGDRRKAMTIEEVAKTLNVASRSVQRYRQRGLVVHSVVFPDGSRKLGCFEDALDRFVRQNQENVNRAAAFTRVSDMVERQITEEARRIRQEQRASLNTIARMLAKQYGRAHETVRQILMRHDRETPDPIFIDHGPLSDSDAKLIYRAWRRGVPVQHLVDYFGRTAATVHRTINRARAVKLASLDLRYVHLPTFELDDAESVLLSARVVCEGLDRVLPTHDALELLEKSAKARTLSENDEASLIACYNFLKKRVVDMLAALPEWPGARLLDNIETLLRWAALVKRRLVSSALPAALGVIEQHIGCHMSKQPSEEVRSHITLAVDTVSGVIETIDPGKSQRLDRLSRFAVAKQLARLPSRDASQRAKVRHAGGTIAIKPLYADLTEWGPFLDLPERLAVRVAKLPRTGRDIVIRHYGLDGRAPLTCVAIAQQMNITDTAVTRQLAGALAELRRRARQQR